MAFHVRMFLNHVLGKSFADRLHEGSWKEIKNMIFKNGTSFDSKLFFFVNLVTFF